MATEDQLNNQRELNKALGEYTSGLTDASDFISILSSRSAELVDQYRSLGRLAKGDFTEGNKQALTAIKQVAKAARDMQNPYEDIKSLQKDIEKAERNRRQLINNIGSESQKLSSREKRDLQAIEAQRKKILSIENQQRVVEDKLGKQRVSEAEDFLDLQTRIKEQKEFVNELSSSGLDEGSEAYRQAEASLQTMEAQRKAKERKLTDLQKEFLTNEEILSTERDSLESQEQGLSLQQKMLIALQEALGAQEKGLDYLEDQEERLKRIARAQSLYNNTLGLSGKLLQRLGVNGTKLQEAIDAGSERANDLAKQLTKGGQEAVGFGGKLRIFFAGLGTFVKNLAKEIAILFSVAALKKLIVDPIAYAFRTIAVPAKRVISEIKGYFSSLTDFIADKFFSIQGFVETFKEGEQLSLQLSQNVADVATSLGIADDEADSLFRQAGRIASKLAMLPEDVLKLTESLNQAFKTTQSFSDETLLTFSTLVQRLGFTTDEAAEFVKLSQLSGVEAENFTEETQLQIRALKAKNNIALSEKEVMQEIANASAATQLSMRGQGRDITKAAFEAKKLGLELSKVEGISRQILDFETSISKEMEAELLLGRDLNLDRARQAALSNDLATVASEIALQAGSADEFGRMSLFTQDALASAIGMTRDELGDLLKTQELLAGTGFEDMMGVQQEYVKLVQELGSEEAAILELRERGLSEELTARTRSASAQELEILRQRALVEEAMAMAREMMPVVRAFRDILQTVEELRTTIIRQLRPFFREFGILINDAGEAMEGTLFAAAEKLGKKLNDIGITLISFARESGPAIKETFLAVFDVFQSIYGLIGNIILELFNIKGSSNIADPLKRSLDLVKTSAESISNYVRDIDAARIASGIQSAASGIVSFYEGLRATVNYIKENPLTVALGAATVAGITTLVKSLVQRGGTPLTPLFTKEVGGGGGLFSGLRGQRYAGGQFMPGGGRAPAGGAVAGRNLMGLQLGSKLGGSAGSLATSLGGTALGTVGVVAGAGMALGAIGKGAYDVAQLNNRSTSGERAKATGGLTGALGGAAAGAAIGSVIPIVGTVLGAGIGALIGYASGRMIGGLDKFQDNLDKARKRLEKAEQRRSIALDSLNAANAASLDKTIGKLQVKFDSISEISLDGSLEVPEEKLLEFAKEAFASGKLTPKQFQDVLEGKLTGIDVLNVATENARIEAQRITQGQKDAIESAGERAQREAEQAAGLTLGQATTASAKLETVLDEKGNLQNVEATGANLVEFIQNQANDFINENPTILGLSSSEITSAIESGFKEYTKVTPAGAFIVELKEEQVKALEEFYTAIFTDLDNNITADIGEDRIKELALTTIKGSKFTSLYDILEKEGFFGKVTGEANLEEVGKVLGVGLSAINNEFKATAADIKAAKEEAEATNAGLQENLIEFNEAIDKIFTSMNINSDNALQLGNDGGFQTEVFLEGLRDTFITNQTDESFGQGLEQLFTQIQSKGISADEKIQIINYIQNNIEKLPKDISRKFAESEFYTQNVEDGSAPSSRGPFTITDKFGATAVTAVGDEVVVSPNIQRIQDGVMPTAVEYLLSQLSSHPSEGTNRSGNMSPADEMAMKYKYAILDKVSDPKERNDMNRQLMMLPLGQQAEILSKAASASRIQDGITGEEWTGSPDTALQHGFFHMGNNPDYFNSKALYHDDQRYSDFIKRSVYAGTHAYNPYTEVLTRLSKQVEIDDSTKLMSMDERSSEAHALREKIQYDQMITEMQNSVPTIFGMVDGGNTVDIVKAILYDPLGAVQVALGGLSLAAAATGVGEPVSVVLDLINAGISGFQAGYYALKGEGEKALFYTGMAGLNLAAAIPVAGNIAGAAALGKTTANIGSKTLARAASGTSKGSRILNQSLRVVSDTAKKIDKVSLIHDAGHMMHHGGEAYITLGKGADYAIEGLTDVSVIETVLKTPRKKIMSAIKGHTAELETPQSQYNHYVASVIHNPSRRNSKEGQNLIKQMLMDSGMGNIPLDEVRFENKDIEIETQKVADAASISNNGPFTIQDSKGNLAVTHPNDKLVVSPNVSYVSDGISGKGGPVFPISEGFGALDVKVNKHGVAVQKIKDGTTAKPVKYIEVAGSTSGTRIASSDVISQLGVSGVTSSNFRSLFVAGPAEYFTGILYRGAQNNSLSAFKPSTDPSPSLDYFNVNYKDGASDEIKDSGNLSFPREGYKNNDIDTIKASGNGLLALARAFDQLKGSAHKYNIGFKQNRESSLLSFDSSKINDLTASWNNLSFAVLYKALMEEDMPHFKYRFIRPDRIEKAGGVEDYIKNGLTVANDHTYIPKSIMDTVRPEEGTYVDANVRNTMYQDLGLPGINVSEVDSILSPIPKISRIRDLRPMSFSPKLREAADKLKELHRHQYITNVLEFIKKYVTPESYERFKNIINPDYGVGHGYRYFSHDGFSKLFTDKTNFIKGTTSSAQIKKRTGTYAEGSIDQEVKDGSALASRGPFTITDKFGATAITAKGDGVVVSPNISYVNDGMTNATAIGNTMANNTSQGTTVVETTTTDTSTLEQEVTELKQIMAGFVQQMNQVVNRPVVVEMDGNKVGESLGRNSYRMQ